MVFFAPVDLESQLPEIGTSIERAVMDWKEKFEGAAYELAKDVAAFANHIGGTLLIGVCEDRPTGRLAHYKGLHPKAAKALRDDFSSAVRDRCSSRPRFDSVICGCPGNDAARILAVNVWPSTELVGVKVAGDSTREGYGGEAFTFPIRGGTDCRYLTPTEIAFHMIPTVRRNSVLLRRIAEGERVRIVYTHTEMAIPTRLLEIDEEANLVVVEASPKLHLPLDRIESVYREEEGDWIILIGKFR